MSEKDIDSRKQLPLSENVSRALDISYRLSDGGFLRALGINADSSPTLAGLSHRDVLLTLEHETYEGRNPSFRVLREINSAAPIQDKGWFVRLISALARQEHLWIDSYDFGEILEFTCDPDIPIPDISNDDWSLEREAEWMRDVTSSIDTRDYNYIWDFEDHRQDGEGHYDEWHDDTEELRR